MCTYTHTYIWYAHIQVEPVLSKRHTYIHTCICTHIGWACVVQAAMLYIHAYIHAYAHIQVEPVLSKRPCSKCNTKIYEASLDCANCKCRFKSCVVTGAHECKCLYMYVCVYIDIWCLLGLCKLQVQVQVMRGDRCAYMHVYVYICMYVDAWGSKDCMYVCM